MSQSHKTNVHAEAGQADIVITREFDLPVDRLFTAYIVPEIVAQWMGTKVLKLENQRHGGYEFETSDAQGNVLFRAHGVIHACIPNEKIVRTFEIEQAPYGPQLEFLEFGKLTDDTSKLHMHMVFRSAALRDQMLQLPFARGIHLAHNRLQDIVKQLI